MDAHGKKVFESAMEFADEYRANLTVVHANGSERIDHARRKLEELTAPFGTKAAVVVEQGEVSNVVASTATKLPADMLVIGRSPSPGVFGRLRTHAYPIIRQSPCPVISV